MTAINTCYQKNANQQARYTAVTQIFNLRVEYNKAIKYSWRSGVWYVIVILYMYAKNLLSGIVAMVSTLHNQPAVLNETHKFIATAARNLVKRNN